MAFEEEMLFAKNFIFGKNFRFKTINIKGKKAAFES